MGYWFFQLMDDLPTAGGIKERSGIAEVRRHYSSSPPLSGPDLKRAGYPLYSGKTNRLFDKPRS